MDISHLGKKILELEYVSKSYDGKTVVNNFNYVFKRGERAGIIGPNGSGKSTFLNIITGSLRPDKGKVITGETIKFGYFRQEGINVDDSKKVIEVITDIAESIKLGKNMSFSASQFLHYFGFARNVQHDLVAKLSGGEKRRLYLMTVLMHNPNFLLLDEPTNDLDIDTLNLLEEFLDGYDGCLIIVSHDRYFVDRLVDHIFVFGTNGQIKDFPGNYTQYRLNKLKIESKKVSSEDKEINKDTRVSRQKVGLTYKEQKELEQLELEIDQLEAKKTLLLDQMNSGNMESLELINASKEFDQIEKDLELKTDRWLELSEKT
jgi:ATP-binding cassette subfamily F protein uup